MLSGASNDNLTGKISGPTTSSGVAKGSVNKLKKQNKNVAQASSRSLSQANSQFGAQLNTPINKKSYQQAKQMADNMQQQSRRTPTGNRINHN